jgi:molecular chaperone GrpE
MELSEMFDLDGEPSAEEGGTEDELMEEEPVAEEDEEPEDVPAESVQDLEERFLRLQAEFDNYRKFMEKTLSDGQKRAGERMACEVLDVLDNLERALSAKGDEKGLRDGVQMVYAQMYDVLGRWGVSEVQADGCEFDPYLHEAVERVDDSDEPNGTIVKVYQKGFSLNSNVIRHARVAVAARQCDEESPDEGPEDGAASEEDPADATNAAGDELDAPPKDGGEDAPEEGADDSHNDDMDDKEN